MRKISQILLDNKQKNNSMNFDCVSFVCFLLKTNKRFLNYSVLNHVF